jgi:hypothetical protein
MAMEQVQGILEGLKLAQARRAENMRAAQEAVRAKQQQDYQDSEAKNRADTLTELVKQHGIENQRLDATSKVAAAFQKLQQLKDQQQIATGSQQSGIPIPGGQVFQPPPGSIGVPSMQTIPGTGDGTNPDVQVPFYPASQWDAMQAQRAQVQQQPEIDRKNAEAAALQAAMEQRQLATKASDEARQVAIDKANNDRAMAVGKQHDDAEALKAKLDRENQFSIAQLKQKPVDDPNFDPTFYTNGSANGTVSKEDITKLPKDQQQIIKDINTKAGINPIAEKQKDFFRGTGEAIGVIPKMQAYTAALDINNPLNPMGEEWATAKANAQTIKDNVQQATNTMYGGAAQRPTQARLQAAQDAFVPDFGPGFNVNFKNKQKTQNYIDTINEVFNGETSGMTPGQQAALRAQVGLNKYPHSAATSKQPGGPAPVLQPQVQPGQTAPQVQKWGRDANGNPVLIQ